MGLIDIALVGLAAVSASQDMPPSHRAHVHGVGQLTIAMDESGRVEAELDAPGDTVFGFEGAPTSAVQHQSADRARAQLLDGTGIIRFSAGASCTFEHAGIVQDGDAGDSLDEEHGSDEEHGHHADHDHEDDGHHMHSDVRVIYHFACSRPDRLRDVETGLFDLFERFEKIDTVFLSRDGQQGFELTPSSPVHRLQR